MNRRASTSLGSELNVDDLSRTPKLPLRPHTTDDSAFLEDDLQLGKDKERPQQPTLEDLARALRERSQVHAWMDSESLDDSPEGTSDILQQLKESLTTWRDVKQLTDHKLAQEFKIGANYRKEIIRRIKPLIPMSSPLTSDRPKSEAPQTGTMPRLLGGVIDLHVNNFPPLARKNDRGEWSTTVSYPFRLASDNWSIDLAPNRHWVNIHLTYRGRKESGVYRVTSVWFHDRDEKEQLPFLFDPKIRSFLPNQSAECCWATKTLQHHFRDGCATLRIQILEGGNS